MSNDGDKKDKDDVISRVLIMFAMQQEALPFINSLNLKLISPSPFGTRLPFVANQGLTDTGDEIIVVWNGRDNRFGGNNVATTAAAVSAYCSVQAFNPDLVISAGTAGGFQSRGGSIGQVYLSSKCVFHHRRIPGQDGKFEE